MTIDNYDYFVYVESAFFGSISCPKCLESIIYNHYDYDTGFITCAHCRSILKFTETQKPQRKE